MERDLKLISEKPDKLKNVVEKLMNRDPIVHYCHTFCEINGNSIDEMAGMIIEAMALDRQRLSSSLMEAKLNSTRPIIVSKENFMPPK